jgi:LCP family protein required for cell wall assembly
MNKRLPRSSRSQSRSGPRLPLWGLGLLAVVVLIVLVVSSVWLFRTVLGLASVWEAPDPGINEVSRVVGQPQSDSEEETGGGIFGNDPVVSPDILTPWSGTDRVNILVLGIDQRCGEDGPTRTDTMIVLTMDPVGLSAAMLSLPRDLWVEVPGFGINKINQAHFLGEINDFPGGGPGLAVQTVEATLGISLDYFVTVDFEAFVEIVDEIEGIDVDVPEDIADDTYPDNCYGYDPFYITAGEHHLDGRDALKYARTRATFGGDIDRAGRQQQVIMALRDKILRLDMVPRLVARSPEMWQIVQENVNTSLSLNDAIQLALLARDIPGDRIRNEVIDFDYVSNETTPDGQQVLVPIRDRIRILRDELFAPPLVPTPVIENLPQMMVEEGARVAIYNGTREFGLAASTQAYLLEYNFNVTEVGNADSAEYRTTQVIDYGSYPNTARYLTQIMGIPPLNISNGNAPPGDFDVLVILGEDWEVPGTEQPDTEQPQT